MRTNQLNYLIKIGILLLGISFFLLNCQNDDLSRQATPESETIKKQSRVQVKTGDDVSKKAVEYLKLKTNNTLKVSIGKNNIILSKGAYLSRESALGTVETNKEIVVYNETNTKHTFKVTTVEEDKNSITNIIVVETENTTYEYFLKYNFIDGIPYDYETNTIDLSQFNGTIETYNSSGQLTGTLVIVDGDVDTTEGETSPCPDETELPDDDENTTGGTGSGGGSNNTPPDGDNTSGGGPDDVPEFENPDTPCGLSWHYDECDGGASDIHSPRPNSTLAGGMCSGSILVITDCDGNILASGRNSSANRETLPDTNPCGGTTGILIEIDDDCAISDSSFNNFYSTRSPFNVDLSDIRQSCDSISLVDIESQKFLCIYEKLSQSPKFKNLFIDTFGESENLNVNFKIADSIPGANGQCEVISGHIIPSTGQVVDLEMEIKIDRSYLNNSSAIAVAKTILHESLHAYLILKHIDCNAGTPFEEIIEDINDKSLGELLNYYYDTSCPLEEDHEFIFNHMIPTMSGVFSEIRDSLISASNQQSAQAVMFINEDNPSTYPDGSYIHNMPWDWDAFYKYLSMSGLHQTDSFNWAIPPGSIEHQNYYEYAITYGTDAFSEDCID